MTHHDCDAHGQPPRIDLTAKHLNVFPDGCLVCRSDLLRIRRPAGSTGLDYVFECGTTYRREDLVVEVFERGECCNALEVALQDVQVIKSMSGEQTAPTVTCPTEPAARFE